MKPQNTNAEKVFDDIARMAGGAVSIFSGLTRQAKDEMRARVDEFAARMDLVPREDFERLEIMLAETRRRVEALEKQLGAKSAPKAASPKKKTAKSKK